MTMLFRFYKFQANGNDFILLDDRKDVFPQSSETISGLCHRHFGIGADGLMLVKASDKYDFEMLYFNADGYPAEMCGNGGRSIAALAFMKGIAGKAMRFYAPDGEHEARVEASDTEKRVFDVSLKMQPVFVVQWMDADAFLNTGVPHLVRFVSRVNDVDVEKQGRTLRNDERFSPAGTNVNFVEIRKNRLFVRTYERGVEGETLSCGTGVTASAIAASFKTGQNNFVVHTRGGDFQVGFQKKQSRFEEIWLRGPAQWVFEGEVFL